MGEDAQGALWFGSPEGLGQLDKERRRMRCWRTAEGMASDDVIAIVEEDIRACEDRQIQRGENIDLERPDTGDQGAIRQKPLEIRNPRGEEREQLKIRLRVAGLQLPQLPKVLLSRLEIIPLPGGAGRPGVVFVRWFAVRSAGIRS